MAVDLDVESADVLRLVLQFLREQHLPLSVATVAQEASVGFNVVDSIDAFSAAISSGRWEKVLPALSHARLPQSALWRTYEQASLELLEKGEAELVRKLLRAPALESVRQSEPEKVLRLEHACSRLLTQPGAVFRPAHFYTAGESTASRRAAVAEGLLPHLREAPPGRLLTLLQRALRAEYSEQDSAVAAMGDGMRWDLFAGAPRAPKGAGKEEKPVKKQCGILKFEARSHPEIAAFAPDGQSLVTGSVDGFLELWDPESCTLRKDLDYQARGDIMSHAQPILSVAFTKEGARMASGSQDGKIKIWDLRTGRTVKRIGGAHSKGVTSLVFSRDEASLLSASFDETAKVFGLKSGKALKEFRGHESFVNAAVFSYAQDRVLTASSDGTIKVFDARTRECLATVRPRRSLEASDDAASAPETQILDAVHSLSAVPHAAMGEVFVAADRGTSLYLLNALGEILRSIPAHPNPLVTAVKASPPGVSCVAVSPKGKFIYVCTEDGGLTCLELSTGELRKRVQVADRELIGVTHHPTRNLLVTYADDGSMKLWRP